MKAYACITSVSSSNYIFDQHFSKFHNKNELIIKRENYIAGAKVAL